MRKFLLSIAVCCLLPGCASTGSGERHRLSSADIAELCATEDSKLRGSLSAEQIEFLCGLFAVPGGRFGANGAALNCQRHCAYSAAAECCVDKEKGGTDCCNASDELTILFP